MEFVGKVGDSGGGMFVVSILFNLEVFSNGVLFLIPEMDIVAVFINSPLRSSQSPGQSGSGNNWVCGSGEVS